MNKNKKQTSKFTALADWVQWAVVAVLFLTSFALVLSKFNTPLGFRLFSIDSGSMTPAIRQGELVIVKPQASYAEGDIITFSHRNDPTQFTTHRLVQRSEDKDLNRVTFTTKGDANDSPDLATTIKSQIVGKVLFSIPLIGYLVAFAKTQLGFVILVVIPATILIYEESKNLKKEISQAIKDKKESSTEDVKEEPVKPKKRKTKRKKKSVKK